MTDWTESEDRKIWKSLGKKSPKQIAESIGRTPEEVLQRKNEMISAVDSISLHERRMKLVVDLEDMAEEAREKAKHMGEKGYGPAMTAAIGAMKAVLAEVKHVEKQSSNEVQVLNELRIQELLRLIDVTVHRAISDISDQYDIPEQELGAIFQSHLRPAAEELES